MENQIQELHNLRYKLLESGYNLQQQLTQVDGQLREVTAQINKLLQEQQTPKPEPVEAVPGSRQERLGGNV